MGPPAVIPGHLAQAQQMATQFNPTNPAKSNQFWDFSTKRFASRFFFQVQILGGQSANCHRFFPLQIRAPKASVCGGMVFASDNNSLETFWKPFPKSLTLLVHHSIFPGKDEHGIFCHCYLTLNIGSFLPPPNLQKKNRGVKSSQGTNQTFGSTSRMERLHNFIRWFYVGGPKASWGTSVGAHGNLLLQRNIASKIMAKYVLTHVFLIHGRKIANPLKEI